MMTQRLFGRCLAIAIACAAFSSCLEVVDHSTPCSAENCNGCCDADGVCQPGDQADACGPSTGGVCSVCASGLVCGAGVCSAGPDAGLVDAGLVDAGLVDAGLVDAGVVIPGTDGGPTCGPSNCAGCCNGNSCVPPDNSSDANCGKGGVACAWCKGATSYCGPAATCIATPTTACALTITPTDAAGPLVDFGTQHIGSTLPLPITLENTGTADCEVSKLTLNPGLAFAVVPITLPKTIPVGQSLSIAVTFQPTTAGSHMSYVMIQTSEHTVSDCPASGPVYGCRTVDLVGSAITTPATPPAALFASPSALDFGKAQVGCKGLTRELQLINTGTTPVTLPPLTFPPSSEFQFASPPPSGQLKGGQSAVVRIRFEPTVLGARSGTLSVSYSGAGPSLAVTLTGLGIPGAATTDTFTQNEAGLADVLLVIDDSSSMLNQQQNLSTGASAFLAQATAAKGVFHVGVVTTHQGAPYVNTTGANIAEGMLVGPPKIVDASSQAPSLEKNMVPGVRGSVLEAGLSAFRTALLPPNVTQPALNGGFLRADAKLGVVFVSDEDDQSGGAPEDFVRFAWNLKGASAMTERVRFYSVVGDTGPNCHVATIGLRYQSATTLGGGLVKGLCSAGSTTLTDIGADLFQLTKEFPLSVRVDTAAPLVVKVDGVVVPATDYTLDTARNLLVFTTAPAAGSVITVSSSGRCAP